MRVGVRVRVTVRARAANPNPNPDPNPDPDPKQVRDADLVAVLRRGRLVELGTPAELARADGWFATSSPLARL